MEPSLIPQDSAFFRDLKARRLHFDEPQLHCTVSAYLHVCHPPVDSSLSRAGAFIMIQCLA